MDMPLETKTNSSQNNPGFAILLLVIMTFFAPMLLNLEFWGPRIEVVIASMTWEFNLRVGLTELFNPFYLQSIFLFSFLRFLFVFWIFRYFNKQASKIQVLVIGILAEIQPMLLMLLEWGIIVPLTIILPIPILFLTGVILLRLRGPP